MQRRRIGEVEVSAIGLGGMPMSVEGRPDESRSVATIHADPEDAGPSWVASGTAVVLALVALATPFAMTSAIAATEASTDTGYAVRWGGPVTLALAAAWVAAACLSGSGGRAAGADRGRGWDRPGAARHRDLAVVAAVAVLGILGPGHVDLRA